MKALLLAATSSLALTGFAMAQTATTVTVPKAPAASTPVVAEPAPEPVVAETAPEPVVAETAAEPVVAETATKPVVAEPAAEAVVAEPAAEPVVAETVVAETVVVAPDVNAPALSAENPGMLGSWIMNRRIWTTNQPSSTTWSDTALTERPAEWTDIAKVDDIVVDAEGDVQGYIADIGGFLGLGAKRVLLGKDALHFVKVGDDAFFATNFTKEELQALPDFDATTVMK